MYVLAGPQGGLALMLNPWLSWRHWGSAPLSWEVGEGEARMGGGERGGEFHSYVSWGLCELACNFFFFSAQPPPALALSWIQKPGSIHHYALEGAKSVTAVDPAAGLKAFLQGPKWPGVVGATSDGKLVFEGGETRMLSGGQKGEKSRHILKTPWRLWSDVVLQTLQTNTEDQRQIWGSWLPLICFFSMCVYMQWLGLLHKK